MAALVAEEKRPPVEGVFAPGVSGMGPALTPKGKRIVDEKMARRDRVLDDLERRGLNVRALAHRHHDSCGCAGGCSGGSCGADTPCEDVSKGGAIREAAEAAELPQSLEAAREHIERLEGRIAHLEHELAVRDNMVKLLREALAEARRAEARREGDTGRSSI